MANRAEYNRAWRMAHKDQLARDHLAWQRANREHVRRNNRERYQKDKESYKLRAEVRRKACRAFLTWIKLGVGCFDCGYKAHTEALEFDHVRGDKHNDVARMAGAAWALIQEELVKCEVVCANCHRVRTNLRRRIVRAQYTWQAPRIVREYDIYAAS